MDYGAIGDGVTDDSAAIQSAMNAAAASDPSFKGHYSKATVYFPPQSFRIAKSLTISQSVRYEGYGATLLGPITTYPRITAATPIAATVTDQTGGACFTDSLPANGGLYWPEFRGLTIKDFRYGMCSQCYAWISPMVLDVMFYNCDIGMFCFQGSQNWTVLDFESANCNVVFVAAATCMTSSMRLPINNYFCDGLTMGSRRMSSGAIQNSTFDFWFSASILQPLVADVNNWKMVPETTYQQASGRIIYIPSRGSRGLYSHKIGPLNIWACPRGAMLTANPINCNFHDIAGEQCFTGDTIPPTQSMLTILKLSSWKCHGLISNIDAVNSTTNSAPNAIVFVPYIFPGQGVYPSALIGNNIHGTISDITQFTTLNNYSMITQ